MPSMPEELQTINLQNLNDVIYLINESSRGMSFEYDLETFGFLSLARYWNFSYEHSLIRYVDGEAAAVIINCVDPDAHDAYTFYWGAVPKFRTRKISFSLFDASCQQLFDKGYNIVYGDAVLDRAVRRYRFIQGEPQHEIIQLRAMTPNLPPADPAFQVRPIDAGMLGQHSIPPNALVHWCQRRSFLRNAASYLHFVGAFRGDTLAGYMVLLAPSSNTVIVDMVASNESSTAGNELVRWLVAQNYRPPFIATHVFEQSYAFRSLTSMGFREQKRLSTLFRDLHKTCRAKAS